MDRLQTDIQTDIAQSAALVKIILQLFELEYFPQNILPSIVLSPFGSWPSFCN